jgi:hypothetical protein
MTSLRHFALLLFLLLVPLHSASPAEPIPGGILDSTGRTAYLTGAGGIDAVTLASGQTLWSTREAQRPLLVAAARLYALALTGRNEMHVLGFDLINKGKKVYCSEKIEFPAWVITAEAPGRSFRCTWRRDKAILFLSWEASASSDLGPAKQASGEVRIDLDSGSVKTLQIGEPRAAVGPITIPQLEKLFVRWHRSIAGQLHAVVVEELPDSTVAERKQRLVLRIWNERTGRESLSRELIRGQSSLLPGLDGIHLWVRDASRNPDEVGEGRQRWSVYSALDGHLVARPPYLPGTQEASLFGARAYYLTASAARRSGGPSTGRSYELHAVDVESGKTLWRRPLASRSLRP